MPLSLVRSNRGGHPTRLCLRLDTAFCNAGQVFLQAGQERTILGVADRESLVIVAGGSGIRSELSEDLLAWERLLFGESYIVPLLGLDISGRIT